eukprot:365428-Chlamydomonas_euryale.AAC.19
MPVRLVERAPPIGIPTGHLASPHACLLPRASSCRRGLGRALAAVAPARPRRTQYGDRSRCAFVSGAAEKRGPQTARHASPCPLLLLAQGAAALLFPGLLPVAASD